MRRRERKNVNEYYVRSEYDLDKIQTSRLNDFTKKVFLTRNIVALTSSYLSLSFRSSYLLFFFSLNSWLSKSSPHQHKYFILKKIWIVFNYIQKWLSHEGDAKYRRYPLKAPIIIWCVVFFLFLATSRNGRRLKDKQNTEMYIYFIDDLRNFAKKMFSCT